MKRRQTAKTQMKISWPYRLLRLSVRGFGASYRYFTSERAKGIARVMVYCTAACLVVALLSLSSAKGSMGEQALIIGRQLNKLEDITQAPTTLKLNGQAINVASAVVKSELDQVLDRFEAVCENETALDGDFAKPQKIVESNGKPGLLPSLGVLRKQGPIDGVISCLVRGEGDNRRFDERLSAASKNLDMGELGQMRYAYAKELGDGRIHVITAWTAGTFRLNALMPEKEGADAEGSDSPIAMRPPESVRYLTAEAVGSPHGVRVYESKRSPAQVLSAYDKKMPELGWEGLSKVDEVVGKDTARTFTRRGVQLMVFASEIEGRTSVTMVETRN